MLLLLLLPCTPWVYTQNDISCGVPEGQVLALRFLPHLPPDALLELLDKGVTHNAGQAQNRQQQQHQHQQQRCALGL